uniref:F-box protein At5g07610-like n=1 Tax=Erigeron canadensis TaxID=72917 RepID=UPI001CB89119|nr:F-box protein At5g07610-like [Erigeron canadensis]
MNHFKSLPPCHDIAIRITGAKLAFDPAKSPHYKVISFLYNIYPNSSHSLQAYSSETGNWITCRRHPFKPFRQFGSGVYWNDAIYWSDFEGYNDRVFKLDVDTLNLSSIPLPEGILKDDKGRTIDRQLFESRGCLLLSCRIPIDFCRDKWLIRVYEAKTDDGGALLCFEWAVKYEIVDINEVLMVAPAWARMHPYMWSVMCIVVGENNEEDSFVVIRVRTQVILYKIELKSLVMLRDLGPHHPVGSSLFTCFPLVASFAGV